MKRIFHFLMLALLSLAMLSQLVACQSKNTAPATIALESTATVTPEPTPGVDEVRRIIITALLSLNTRSNRMDVTTVLENGEIHKTEIEFVPPDRKRIMAEGTEIIVVGEKVYIKQAGETSWNLSPASAATYLGEPVTEQTIAAMLAAVSYVRKDLLDKQAVNLFQYTSTSKSGDINLKSSTVLWVGQTNGLPYKMVVDGETLAVSNDPATGESKVQVVKAQTTTLIVFDPAIQVLSPIP